MEHVRCHGDLSSIPGLRRLRPPTQSVTITAELADPQVDTATGLMIVSCYKKLLQIFEVVTFVVETFRGLDCPGSYVQVNLGSFQPKPNKALHARILGQYVIHLLDGISEAVSCAVASNQLYTQAISSIRENETKLKRRISKALQSKH